MSNSGRFTNRYNVFKAQASNATSTKVIDVRDYRNVIVRVGTADSANLTLKAQGSIVSNDYPNAPDFSLSQSVANHYTYIQMVDLDNGDTIDGSTGVVASGTDIFKLYELNTNALDYISFTVSGRSAGSITVDILLTDNQ